MKHKENLHPESLMMSYGYDPHRMGQGAVKPPLFMTSSFVFKSAKQAKEWFELMYGKREQESGEQMGFIYSRVSNPNLEITEKRLCIWDEADDAALFQSGMAAVSTVLIEFLKEGDLLLYSSPLYGGTEHFISYFLHNRKISALPIYAGMNLEDILQHLERHFPGKSPAMIYVETPANPTNHLFDIELLSKLADYFKTDKTKPVLVVDNTYLGPLWQHPLKHGADLVIYSATKFIGGHSDLIAGAVLGSKTLMNRVKELRTFLGSMCDPHTAWLLSRSLETLKIRMEQQAGNARKVANFLRDHPRVIKVDYLGFLEDDPVQKRIFENQCLSAGAMISFEIDGGQENAFHFLDRLRIFKLAVSLGSTESLAQHPATMTHAGMSNENLMTAGITPALIRLSIGIEHADDLLADIAEALSFD